MTFSHTRTPDWGSLYKLHFWRWGITLDWGMHRFILDCCPESRDSQGAPISTKIASATAPHH